MSGDTGPMMATAMSNSMPPDDPDTVLDGNAVAGVLAAAFGSDMTDVPERCAHCGTVTLLAELRAYVRAPGSVLRCPACDGVVIRIAETPTGILIDARGARFLRLPGR